MRIGVFGGTFDPPHAGHLAFAMAARDQLELDEVLWMPANRNPAKAGRKQTPARQRLEMVGLLVGKCEGMAASDLEISRGGASYAVDTLSELMHAQPAEYWFLVGADAVRELSTWKQPKRLLQLCRLAVAMRPPLTGGDVLARVDPEFHSKIDFVTLAANTAASTDIRRLIATGKPTLDLDPAVARYIAQHKLYRD
ncbi:MAG: nicotinate-nucleotide adenylyltransferase [Fimbriimonadaceae bacterium]|nr:nicotinate-nucleotide adenylyltransferase [Fimbriimonadaceae bacterium]